MNFIKVKLWNKEIGRLAWDKRNNNSYFIYNPNEDVPDIAPVLAPKRFRKLLKPIYGNTEPVYHRLPPFLADSLPDYWGNLIFQKWAEDQKIPKNLLTPLYRLAFIGKRGMGAFEFEPESEDLNKIQKIDITSLYELSEKIFKERSYSSLPAGEQLTLHSLLQVGTSAGGRQKKAIVAIDRQTGEIRSGQIGGLEGYDYYIVKFGDSTIPIAEIEMAYYEMALEAGIEMENSRLLQIEGINHFITARFDRKNGKKILTQTLAAINPEARTYEDLITTGRLLQLTELEIQQLYRRLVFNVLANNTDDHIKNFSFLMEEGGNWHLAPAYDLTFIFNTTYTGSDIEHIFPVEGKVSGITDGDILEFAKNNDIGRAESIIKRVASAVQNFSLYADKYGISQPFRSIIERQLNETLRNFGIINEKRNNEEFIDNLNRKVSDFRININSKGMFVVSATIEGKRRRRFIRKTMPEYKNLLKMDIFNLPVTTMISITSQLFT